MRKIVMDEAIVGLAEMLAAVPECANEQLQIMPAEHIDAACLQDADALWVRSVTRVNHSLLEHTRIKFVGSCTIGTDHIDQQSLIDHGVMFAHAPGCNARAVVEFVLATVLHWVCQEQRGLDQLTLGIVGYGHIGKQLADMFGLISGHFAKCYVYDPVLKQSGAEPPKSGWSTWEQILQADVISIHVPLTFAEHSDWPTYHLFGAKELEQLEQQLLINTSRGDVIDGDALLRRQQYVSNHHLCVALDVFPNEPNVCAQLIQSIWQATPHIAGHSARGKWLGTWQVFEQYCRWAKIPIVDLQQVMPSFVKSHLLWMQPSWTVEAWYQLAQQVTPLTELSNHMQMLAEQAAKSGSQTAGKEFRHLRRSYRPRLQWQDVQLAIPLLNADMYAVLLQAGVGNISH